LQLEQIVRESQKQSSILRVQLAKVAAGNMALADQVQDYEAFAAQGACDRSHAGGGGGWAGGFPGKEGSTHAGGVFAGGVPEGDVGAADGVKGVDTKMPAAAAATAATAAATTATATATATGVSDHVRRNGEEWDDRTTDEEPRMMPTAMDSPHASDDSSAEGTGVVGGGGGDE